NRHHLLEQRPRLAGASLDHLAVLTVEQPEQLTRRPLHEPMNPGDPRVLALGMTIEIGLAVVLKLEEFEHLTVLVAGVGLEVVEHGDEAAFAIDHAEEILEVLAEETGFPIVEEARLKAAAGDFAAGAPLRRQVPCTIEI